MSHPFKSIKKEDHFNYDMKIISSELEKIFNTSYLPSDKERGKRLRSSSLPYCPVQELWWFMRDEIEEPVEEFSMVWYVTLGHMVHELLQNWVPKFAKKIKIIGLWDATSVGCKNETCPFQSKYPIQALDKKGCSKCGKIPHYQEIASNSKFTSHTDWIIQISGTNRVYVVDIKTTSSLQMWNHNKGKSNKYPQKEYIAQTDSYLVQLYPLLTKMGFKVSGSFILYMPRDNPRAAKLIPVRKKITTSFLERTKEILYRVSEGYMIVGKIINKREPITTKQISQVVEHKLCSSKEDYKENHLPTYGDPCPLLGVCFKSKLAKKLEKQRLKYNESL